MKDAWYKKIIDGNCRKVTTIILFIVLICFGFSSCQTYPNKTGKLVIKNYSFDYYDKITSVYIRYYGEKYWTKAFNSEEGVGVGEDIDIYLYEDKYDIRICVHNLISDRYYETGYKLPVYIKSYDYVFINFDGYGIFKL